MLFIQFGFRPGHSTGAALGSMTDDWLHSIDLGRIIGALYLDLKRAFHTVVLLLCYSN